MKNDLALYGGTPVTKDKIEYSQHLILDEDIRAVTACLESDWLAGRSDTVREFEEMVADYLGYDHAIAVNSATSGLFSVLLHTKRNTDIESIAVPSLTFVATMNAALLAGFSVKIVDVDPNTYLMEAPWKNIGIPVSYAGYPFPLTKNHIVIDAAHQFARAFDYTNWAVSVISTHAIKPLTTGEGGVILCNNESLANELRQITDHGHSGSLYGHNFRMSSIQAALGLSQLERADEMFLIRKGIADIYRDCLKDLPIKLQKNHNNHSNHIFPIILTGQIDRNWFREALLAEGVKTQIHYEPLHIIKERHSEKDRITIDSDFPVSNLMWNHGFSLPMHNAMSFGDARKVVEAVRKIFEYKRNQQ